MNYKAVFIDTWGWMALGYRREPRHAEVKCIYQELRSNRIPIHTSDYVLDEVITLLFRRENFDEATHFMEGIFAAAALGQVRIERVTTDRFLEAWELRKRFQDKPGISFTDLISMSIMKELDICQVLTEDEHFVHNSFRMETDNLSIKLDIHKITYFQLRSFTDRNWKS